MENRTIIRNNSSSFTASKTAVFVFTGIAIVTFILGFISGAKVEGQKIAQILKTTQVVSPSPYATETLNKDFDFPITDGTGKIFTKIKYILQNADLMNQIILNGQPYNSVAGKTFLIINLKLINSSSQGVQLATRDYVRLSTDKGQNWYAADIHNDPVQIQAISTKLTRIGFPINSNSKTIWLQVGEVNGKKDLIKLNLK